MNEICYTHKGGPLLKIMDLIYEFNLVSRSATETLPLPHVHQQEVGVHEVKKAKKSGFSDEQKACTLKTFLSKRGLMYKAKAEKYPPNPKTQEEIVIEGIGLNAQTAKDF